MNWSLEFDRGTEGDWSGEADAEHTQTQTHTVYNALSSPTTEKVAAV